MGAGGHAATGWARCLFALLALGAGACTGPQSGIYAQRWCHPAAADNLPYVMLDDMEDGDSVPCSRVGNWTIDGTADFTPTGDTAPEQLGGPALPVVLSADDQATLDPMFEANALGETFRAHHLHGTIAPGGYGSLVLPLAPVDLSGFPELDFWARSDVAADTILVGLFTVDGRYFSESVTIQPGWGYYSAPLLGALLGADGTAATAADLAMSAKIDFRFLADVNGDRSTFGLWLDDIVLKR